MSEVMLNETNVRANFSTMSPIAASQVSSKGQNTRDTIVLAALEMARQSGLESLTIGTVAQAVSMSKSGVFAHFGSREDLQLAVMEQATFEFAQSVFVPAFKQRRGLPRLKALMENMLKFYQLSEHGCVILSAAHEFDDQPGPVRDAVIAHTRRLRQEIERAISHAVEARDFRADTPVDQVAFECFGIFLATHHDLKTMRDTRAGAHGQAAMQALFARFSQNP